MQSTVFNEKKHKKKFKKKVKKQYKEHVISDVPPNLLIQNVQAQLIGEEEPIMQENVGDLILNAFKSDPNFIGQVNAETEEQLTFQQMRENSVKCALWLKKEGIKKGDVVAICTRNSSAVYAPFLASIYIGAIVNPWEEKHFEEVLQVMYLLLKYEPDLIFVDHDHFSELISATAILKKIKKVIKVITIGKVESSVFIFNSLEVILNYDFDKTEIDMFSCAKNDIRDIAVRTFCSSATDYGKDGVEIPYISFVSPSNRQTPVMSPGKIGLWYGSLCWTHGSLLTVHAILSHVTAIKSVVQTMENFVKVINKYKVTWAFLDINTCSNVFPFKTTSYSMFDNSLSVFSLEALLFDYWKTNFQANFFAFIKFIPIIRVYSRPETGVIMYRRETNGMNYVNYAVPNVQAAIVNNKEGVTIPNKSGAIYCKTPYISYISETIQPWYYTNDKGYYSPIGIWHIIPFVRKDRYIQYKDTIISKKYIEYMLLLYSTVTEAVVVGVNYPVDGQHPRAHVGTKPGVKVTEEEIMEFMIDRISSNLRQRDIVFIAYEWVGKGKFDQITYERLMAAEY